MKRLFALLGLIPLCAAVAGPTQDRDPQAKGCGPLPIRNELKIGGRLEGAYRELAFEATLTPSDDAEPGPPRTLEEASRRPHGEGNYRYWIITYRYDNEKDSSTISDSSIDEIQGWECSVETGQWALDVVKVNGAVGATPVIAIRGESQGRPRVGRR